MSKIFNEIQDIICRLQPIDEILDKLLLVTRQTSVRRSYTERKIKNLVNSKSD